MAIGNVLHRVPKWAWYTTAGVGLAGGAIQLYRARDTRTGALAGTEDVGGGGGATGVGLAPSPAPGIVVPPVIIPGQNTDPLAGVAPLQELYIGAVGGIIGEWQNVARGWQDVYTPVIEQNRSLIDIIGGGFQDTNQALLAIAVAGAAPTAVIQTPVAALPAVAAPVAAPAAAARCPSSFPEGSPPDCRRVEVATDCHCEGTGRNRKCWTRRLHNHRYQTGRFVTVSVDKVKDGC